jgi:hypothetical protein
MRTGLILTAVGVAFALGGCGEATEGTDVTEGATTPQTAGPSSTPAASPTSGSAAEPAATGGLPPCAEVWRVGEKLPRGYDGCRVDGRPADDPRAIPCESGRPLHRHATRWYAVEGGKVIRTETVVTKDPVYRRVLAACTA